MGNRNATTEIEEASDTESASRSESSFDEIDDLYDSLADVTNRVQALEARQKRQGGMWLALAFATATAFLYRPKRGVV